MTRERDCTHELDAALTVEAGCLRSRTWRYRVQRTVPAAALVEEMKKLGWQDVSRSPALREMHHPRGHRILVVPQTGRIQIRLDLGVPEPERTAAARAVGLDLLAALDAISSD